MRMKFKKDICVLAGCIIILSTLTGCGGSNYGSNLDTKKFKETADFYLYNSLNNLEKEFYAHICTAVEEFKTEAAFAFETKEERKSILEKFFGGEVLINGVTTGGKWFVRDVFYEQPQYFWVNPNSVTYSTLDFQKDDRYLITVKFDYLMNEKEAMAQKSAFDNKVQEITAGARSAGGTFEQVLYVHDYLCENVVYDKELYESKSFYTKAITAYGALMEGKTICSGYALAFSLLMKELGYDGGVEFNNYGQIAITEGHVWNYIELDGENYYFDVTWDDKDDENLPFFYEYFGITTEELKLSNYFKRDDAPVPYCGGTKYNYYVYNGFNIPQYSFEVVSAVMAKQINAGSSHICLKFGDYGELLHAETELFTKQRIYELLDVSSAAYCISGSLSPRYMYIDI